jgi:hypothetical protein
MQHNAPMCYIPPNAREQQPQQHRRQDHVSQQTYAAPRRAPNTEDVDLFAEMMAKLRNQTSDDEESEQHTAVVADENSTTMEKETAAVVDGAVTLVASDEKPNAPTTNDTLNTTPEAAESLSITNPAEPQADVESDKPEIIIDDNTHAEVNIKVGCNDQLDDNNSVINDDNNPFTRPYVRDALWQTIVAPWLPPDDPTTDSQADDDSSKKKKRKRAPPQRPMAGIDFLAPGQSEESFLQAKSVVRRLRAANQSALSAVERHATNTDAYRVARRTFQQRAFDELLHQLFQAPSDQVCMPIAHGRDWFLRVARRHFHAMPAQHCDVDLFGNHVIDFMRDVRIAFAPDSRLLPYVRLCAYARMSAFRFSDHHLTSELLLVGPTSTGKTLLLEMMKALLAPGMSRTLTYTTEKAALFDGGVNHVIDFYDEAPMAHLGFGDRRAHGTPWQKSMKSQKIVHVSTASSGAGGSRVQKQFVWSNMTSSMQACNALPSLAEHKSQLDAVEQRYVVLHMRAMKLTDGGSVTRALHSPSAEMSHQIVESSSSSTATTVNDTAATSKPASRVEREVDLDVMRRRRIRCALEPTDEYYPPIQQEQARQRFHQSDPPATLTYPQCLIDELQSFNEQIDRGC